MSNRLDRQSSEAVTSKLGEIGQIIDELSARQRASGQSGQLGYLSQTNNTWDYTATITTPSTSSGIDTSYTLLFTGDGTQQFPICNPSLDIFINSVTEANRLTTRQYRTNGTRIWTDGTNSVILQSLVEIDKTSPGAPDFSDPLKLQWYTDFSVFGTATVYIKAYVSGTSKGSLLLTRTF